VGILFGGSKYGYLYEANMLKKSTTWAVLIYGLILISLGYLGFHLHGSYISLYSGVGSGIFLIISSILMRASIQLGSYLALTISLLLTVTFSIRYTVAGKGVPAILAVLSACMFLFLLSQTTKWKR